MKLEPDSPSSHSGHGREKQSFLWELAHFRALLDQSNDSIEVVDPVTLRFLDANEKACSELGYNREELLSMTVFDIDPNISKESASRSLERLRQSEFVLLESVHCRKDGTIFPVEVNFKIVQLDKQYVVALSRDITERKRAAALLEESEKRFRALYQRAPVGISVVDPHTGRFLQVNAKYCEIAGRTQEEMLRLRSQDITHPERCKCKQQPHDAVDRRKNTRLQRGKKILPAGRTNGMDQSFCCAVMGTRRTSLWAHRHRAGHYRAQESRGSSAGE
jgi:PAS domain S-box-containing protein